MFDIHLVIDDISITSLEKQDILPVQKWINLQNHNSLSEKPLASKEFYERFLEYYVSENEFFLKICKEDKLIGVLKGRMEFKTNNEAWLWYFLIDHEYRQQGIGSYIITNIIKYFIEELGVDHIYTGVSEKDISFIKFWKNNNFRLQRVAKNFFNVSGEDLDMLIMKLEN